MMTANRNSCDICEIIAAATPMPRWEDYARKAAAAPEQQQAPARVDADQQRHLAIPASGTASAAKAVRRSEPWPPGQVYRPKRC
jgi:hypothetical protein